MARAGAAGFQALCNTCTAVGDVRGSGLDTSGHFEEEASTRFRADSEGLLYPGRLDCHASDSTASSIISPHLVQSSPLAAASSTGGARGAGNKDQGCTNVELEERVCVSTHKLNTEGVKGDSDCCRFGSQVEGYGYNTSPSPSPFSEPTFEPYVYCTKTRSETSYSNDSQFSNSSGERSESRVLTTLLDGDHSSPVDVPMSSSTSPSCSMRHRPLSRQNQSGASIEHQEVSSSPSLVLRGSPYLAHDIGKEEGTTLLISPNHASPQVLCETRPVLPPDNSQSDVEPSSPLFFPSVQHQSSNQLPPKHHSPPTTARRFSPPSANAGFLTSLDTQRSRATFLQNKVSGEGSKFSADYLGVKETDMYIKSINTVAKELATNQRAREIHVFVTSERIRLTPPNCATLFRSFLVKDILLVKKCSKNKRIIGVMIWKQGGGHHPSCHILRCQDNLTASALYDALWQQTQKVDQVESCKDTSANCVPRPRPLSTGTISSQGSSSSRGSSQDHASSGFMHRFSALYIGSTHSVKLLSTDNIIEKVLMDSRPSQAVPIITSLSLMEIRYLLEDRRGVAVGGDCQERVFLSHDTCRIRSMGAYSEDKRFAGYVIKEEGKPLAGHVIRCNSAALMVSFMSFLRQSCQLTSHQRGGSFYEELSTDESGDWGDITAENPASSNDSSSSIVRRLRSFTSSISHLTSHSASLSSSSASGPSSLASPSFQSHMQPSHSSHSHQGQDPAPFPQAGKSKDSSGQVTSPLDLGEDDYVKFSVTYIGSASQDAPLTSSCVKDAMALFAEEGIAAGQAAVLKNTIQFQITSLGINLTDKTKKLFIHRNYPRNMIAGYCNHPTDDKLFAVASDRPGYRKAKKVHVFRCGAEPVEQILDAIKYWLKMDPIDQEF